MRFFLLMIPLQTLVSCIGAQSFRLIGVVQSAEPGPTRFENGEETTSKIFSAALRVVWDGRTRMNRWVSCRLIKFDFVQTGSRCRTESNAVAIVFAVTRDQQRSRTEGRRRRKKDFWIQLIDCALRTGVSYSIRCRRQTLVLHRVAKKDKARQMFGRKTRAFTSRLMCHSPSVLSFRSVRSRFVRSVSKMSFEIVVLSSVDR